MIFFKKSSHQGKSHLALLRREGPGVIWGGDSYSSSSSSIFSSTASSNSSIDVGRGSTSSSSSSSFSKAGLPLTQIPWQFWQKWEHFIDSFLHPHLPLLQSLVHRQKTIFNISSGAGVDLAVLLMAKTPADRDILFVKPGRGKVKTNVYSTQEMQQPGLKNILFLHAFTGCDTTSGAFRGRVKLVLSNCTKNTLIFAKPLKSSRTPHHHKRRLRKRERNVSWDGMVQRRHILTAIATKHSSNQYETSKPDMSSLPPTEGAAKQHSFRTYHQVQQWLENELSPELWGWERKPGSQFAPVWTRDPSAPDEILKMIFCRCTNDCSSGKCGCRKGSMKCSHICQNCQGNCVNGIPALENEDDDDEEVEPLPRALPTSIEELEYAVEENIDEEDDDYESPPQLTPGPSHRKRARCDFPWCDDFLKNIIRNTIYYFSSHCGALLR